MGPNYSPTWFVWAQEISVGPTGPSFSGSHAPVARCKLPKAEAVIAPRNATAASSGFFRLLLAQSLALREFEMASISASVALPECSVLPSTRRATPIVSFDAVLLSDSRSMITI